MIDRRLYVTAGAITVRLRLVYRSNASPTCRIRHGSGEEWEYGRKKGLGFGSLRREDSSYSYRMFYGRFLYYYGYRVLSSADADTDTDADRVTTAQLVLRSSFTI